MCRARSINILPEQTRKAPESLLKVKGVLWNMVPGGVAATPRVAVDVGRQPEPAGLLAPVEPPPAAETISRRTYVTRAMIEQYGLTPGCKGCEGANAGSSRDLMKMQKEFGRTDVNGM